MMVGAAARRESVNRYLNYVYGSDTFDQILSDYRRTGRTEAAFALIHPNWIPFDLDRWLGAPAFNIQIDPRVDRCAAEALWGYECPIVDPQLESDHLFPRWLGGLTIGPNRLVLCSAHNRMKSGDIHVYPWEARVPNWVESAIEKIHSGRQQTLSVPFPPPGGG